MTPRDIQLPDGTVRHNVGSDNLSDEDREAMRLTDEQVDLLNAHEASLKGGLWRQVKLAQKALSKWSKEKRSQVQLEGTP